MSVNDFIKTLSEDQKQALLKALQDDGPKTQDKEQTNVRDDFTIDKNKNSKNRRREPVKGRKNEWVDTGEFKDIETPYGERTPRNRQPSKKMDVECSVCGRSFKTDPKYVYGEYHRCSRCVGR
jgi:hypothetical protein